MNNAILPSEMRPGSSPSEYDIEAPIMHGATTGNLLVAPPKGASSESFTCVVVSTNRASTTNLTGVYQPLTAWHSMQIALRSLRSAGWSTSLEPIAAGNMIRLLEMMKAPKRPTLRERLYAAGFVRSFRSHLRRRDGTDAEFASWSKLLSGNRSVTDLIREDRNSQ